jgi:hydrogenase maturation protease
VPRTLILYLGNPIVKNDQIGLIVGSQLAALFSKLPGVEMREFSGSPLDLVSDISGYERLILIDSISTGRPVGSVVLFGEEEILSGKGDVYLHGMNLSEALNLCRRIRLPFPRKLHLVGIESGVMYEFGEKMSGELREKLPGIISEVRRLIGGLIGPQTEGPWRHSS